MSIEGWRWRRLSWSGLLELSESSAHGRPRRGWAAAGCLTAASVPELAGSTQYFRLQAAAERRRRVAGRLSPLVLGCLIEWMHQLHGYVRSHAAWVDLGLIEADARLRLLGTPCGVGRSPAPASAVDAP